MGVLGILRLCSGGYSLVTGVYIGKDIKSFPRVDGGRAYTFSCRYPYFTGIRDVPFSLYRDTYDEAAKDFCPVLWNSN